MAFWNDPNLDPKRSFKFKVSFNNAKIGMESKQFYLAQKADRPKWTVGSDAKVHVLDKEFKFPGKVTWEDVTITFIDGMRGADNMARKAYEYLAAAGWVSPPAASAGSFQGALGTISKGNASGGNDVEVITLDSNGGVVESYKLRNAFITKVDLPGFDYATDTILTAQFTFKYDWAEYI